MQEHTNFQRTAKNDAVETSHWIEYDARHIGRMQRAECGRMVPSDSFSTEPTCEDCRRKLAAYEKAEF